MSQTVFVLILLVTGTRVVEFNPRLEFRTLEACERAAEQWVERDPRRLWRNAYCVEVLANAR